MKKSFALIVALCALATACSPETGTQAEPQAIEVEATDYAFVGLPSTVPAGSSITLTNTSSAELHELVAVRLPDSETRSMEELVATPDALAAHFESVELVILAPPSAPTATVVGTGVLDAPGRYAIVCVVPTGADPTEYMEAAATSDGPPEVAGGPPHLALGMWAEVTVTP